MARKGSIKTPLTILAISITLFVTLSHRLHRHVVHQSTSLSTSFLYLSSPPPPLPSLTPLPQFLSPPPYPPPSRILNFASLSTLLAVKEDSSATSASSSISTVSILIPDWEVLVIASPETPLTPGENYTCYFGSNLSTPARFAGELSFGRGTVFKCVLPENNRLRSRYTEPRVVRSDQIQIPQSESEIDAPDLHRWNSLAYESFTTQHDVVLFVKGVNSRQGNNRPASHLRCVFGDDPSSAVRTAVTSSAQEVFRCVRPQLPENSPQKVSVTLEIIHRKDADALILPSVAQYAPHEGRTIEFSKPKSLMCACTMVYNVGKFLREWVTYHASVGVEKFILYDNDSNDGLDRTVQELNRAGYDVRMIYWPWPKTQEAGFSHCALCAEHICQWMAFIDVDEFILSPGWMDHRKPNPNMLMSSLLPKGTNPARVGQVSVKCVEFGPSNQTEHPVQGVTQGYTCRRKFDRRHKSIVMLEAVHPSLMNMVHHFKLREGFKTSQLGKHRAIVNHYKYQAWPEFKAKFRRRVSAYVVDWRQSINPKSNDRVPGLGFEAVEPPRWAQKFCEKTDERLKVLTRRWFGVNSSAMIWQSAFQLLG
uniref:Glycosyltransferase family 92 protein n=1 Tax=Opuntia streptacantha TaxID=393608 RepID=A0A7C9D2Z5_OPUST